MKRNQGLFAGLIGTAALALGALTLAPAVVAGPGHDHGAKAVVGEKAPNFKLTDTTGAEHSLKDFLAKGEFVVLEWFNPDCPFVVRHHAKDRTHAALYNDFKDRGVTFVAINSGAPGKQGAGLERNRKAIEEYGMQYPVLIDESGKVGKMYDAKTTPHMFIIAKDGTLLYDGGIDNDPRGTNSDRVNYVRQALEQALAGETITMSKTKPYGCSVKYAG